MNYLTRMTGTVQNTIKNNNNVESDPKIRVLDTLYVDKYLNPTENKEYWIFNAR